MSWLRGGVLSPLNEGGVRLRNGLFLGLLGLAFLLLYVIELDFTDPSVDVPKALLPFLVLVVADILLLTEDPLQYSRSVTSRHIAFFRAQFPRVYIQRRYGLPAHEARQRWLGALRPWKDEDHPNHRYFVELLRTRYECRTVFHLQRVLKWISLLSFAALPILGFLTLWGGIDLPRFYSLESAGLTVARTAFPVFLLLLYVYLRVDNRPEEDNPTGVWLKWKAINDHLKDWWDQNKGAA